VYKYELMKLHWPKGSGEAAVVRPAREVLGKILRYETKRERQMYQALNHLERVRRMRRGEDVPPPVAIGGV
jgi:hypothetical protein